MLRTDWLRIIGTVKIAELFGADYVKANIKNAIEGQAINHSGNGEYFLGFKGDKATNKWLEYAYIEVDPKTQRTTFLDYRLPSGERMSNPVKKIIYA